LREQIRAGESENVVPFAVIPVLLDQEVLLVHTGISGKIPQAIGVALGHASTQPGLLPAMQCGLRRRERLVAFAQLDLGVVEDVAGQRLRRQWFRPPCTSD
jgi:hypothetical protein